MDPESLLLRIKELERRYNENCVHFYAAAKEILDGLISSQEYRSLKKKILKETYMSSRARTLEHIEEKLERCEYPCECAFIDDCHLMIKNMLNVHKENDLHTDKIIALLDRMEDSFITYLGRPDLHKFVDQNLHTVNPDMNSRILALLQKYEKDDNGKEDAAFNKQVSECKLSTCYLLCSYLPKSRPSWGRKETPQEDVVHQVSPEQDFEVMQVNEEAPPPKQESESMVYTDEEN